MSRTAWVASQEDKHNSINTCQLTCIQKNWVSNVDHLVHLFTARIIFQTIQIISTKFEVSVTDKIWQANLNLVYIDLIKLQIYTKFKISISYVKEETDTEQYKFDS
jgi:membrane protein CcdC involved in cytochrome C biogenesis